VQTGPATSAAARSPWRTVGALGTAQTLAWASSYYLPAILAEPMARDLGLITPTVFVAFSLAMAVSALLGPAAGRAIDRHGGRPVLLATNLVFALALAVLGLAQGPVGLFAGWLLVGLGMGCGLYEAAFATLVRLYGSGARNPITGITLIAGFASTVGWPLSAWMSAEFGWRGACFGWAALHLLLGLPLNALVPRVAATREAPSLPSPLPPCGAGARGEGDDHRCPGPRPSPPPLSREGRGEPMPGASLRNAVLLSVVFALVWFVSTAMATHLPAMLQAGGASLSAAVAVGALVGPAQVAGRLLEFGVLRHVHPLLSARLAALGHPLGVAVLLALGPPGAAAFALLHGSGNGIMTIAKGTLPLALFGADGYGRRQGWMMMPARVAQAVAPVSFGLLLEALGAGAMWVSAALGLAAFAALMALRTQASSRP
jgi:MFS family permease